MVMSILTTAIGGLGFVVTVIALIICTFKIMEWIFDP